MKRSFCTFFLVASLLCPLATYSLLGTSKYMTAWGRRNSRLDRATTHLNNVAYKHMITSTRAVTYDDLEFLKQFINQLGKTKGATPDFQRGYDILSRMDEHGRLKNFTVEDAQRDPRKFEEIATHIILHHHR